MYKQQQKGAQSLRSLFLRRVYFGGGEGGGLLSDRILHFKIIIVMSDN